MYTRHFLSFSFSRFAPSLFSLSLLVLSVARCVNVPLFYVTLQNGFSTARPQHDNQKRARRTVNRFFEAIKGTSSRWLIWEHPENSLANFQIISFTTIVFRENRQLIEIVVFVVRIKIIKLDLRLDLRSYFEFLIQKAKIESPLSTFLCRR